MHPTDRLTHRDGRRGGRVLAVAAALIGAGVLVTACGGGAKSPGVANVSSSKTSTSSTTSSANSLSPSSDGSAPSTSSGGGPGRSSSGFAIVNGNRNNALKFSECMRSHGVPNFPDPGANGVIQGDFNPSSPAVQTASKDCRKYMGKGAAPTPAQIAALQAQALKFSQCMRAHGVKSFPDPNFGQGGGAEIKISLHAGPGSGLDPRSPIFQAAQKACKGDLPGRVKG